MGRRALPIRHDGGVLEELDDSAMYLIDVNAVGMESGIEESVLFSWNSKERKLERGHEDGHWSSAGFSGSLGEALNKVVAACMLVGLRITEVNIRRKNMEVALNG